MTTQDLHGKTFLVTGANTGIGKATALELARRGGRVYLACRSREKGLAALDDIRRNTRHDAVEFLELDLADFGSIRRCAEAFLARGEPLHGLINNAGLAGQRGVTKQGFELAFGVNHLGHFLLTQLLLEVLRKSAPARIVNVASKAHYGARGIDWEALRRPTASWTGLREYEVSKLCNVLFTRELARRLGRGAVHAYAVHPGVVASDVWRNVPWPVRTVMKMFMLSNEEGARTTLYCATSPEVADRTGGYYEQCREKEPSALARDEALARELWARSEQWTA